MITLLAGASLIAATPALAQGACKTAGSATAKAVALPAPAERDIDFNRALALATSPEGAAQAGKNSPCIRPGKPTIRGENGDPAPRVMKEDAHFAYLAPVPWKRAGQAATLYALVKVWGSGAVRIDALYDAIPTDAVLAKAMAEDWERGGFGPLTVDAATGALVDSSSYLEAQLAKTGQALPDRHGQ